MCSIVLTPHATRPYQDAKQPDEISLLRTGAYNLGFIGVAKTEESRAMLNWWQERCREHCVVQPEDGLFVDQKWIDLVPGFHPGTKILRDPGLNVAYWNLHERTIDSLDPPRCNGSPLYFFHFSGLKTDRLEAISRYQNRFDLGGAPTCASCSSSTPSSSSAMGSRSAPPFPTPTAPSKTAAGSTRSCAACSGPCRARIASGSGTRSRAARARSSTGCATPAVVTRHHRPRGSHRHWLKLKSLAVRARALPAAGRLRRQPDVLPAPDRRPRDDAVPGPVRPLLVALPALGATPARTTLRWRCPVRAPDRVGHRPSGAAVPAVVGGGRRARAPRDRSPAVAGAPARRGRASTCSATSARRPVWARLRAGVSRAIEAAGIPVVRNNLDESADLRESDATYSDFPANNRTRSTSCT